MIKDPVVKSVMTHVMKQNKCIMCKITPANHHAIYNYIIALEKINEKLQTENDELKAQKKEWGIF